MTRQEINASTEPAGNAEDPPREARPYQDPPHAFPPGTTTGWFPLLPRPRPPALPLHQRIDEFRQRAQSPLQGSLETRLSLAAEVLNKAALIASDCALPDLARQLCRRQFDLFHAAAPLTAQAAKLALQPLVNLARLATRNGDPTRAYQILHNAYQALSTKTATRIDGRTIDFQHFIHPTDQHQDPRRFLWTILLADGTRALTTTGRWHDTLTHLQRYKGIGHRMLDGRQAAILAHCATGDTETALSMLDTSTTPEPWEHAVTTCLRTLCLHTAHRSAAPAAAAMIRACLRLEPMPGHLLFRTRLALTAIDLAPDLHPVGSSQLITRTTREAIAGADAHAAHHVLCHQLCRAAMTETDSAALTRLVESSGLGRGHLPPDLLHELLISTQIGETQLVETLRPIGQRIVDHRPPPR